MTERLVSPEETSALMDDVDARKGEFSFRAPPAVVGEREKEFDRVVEKLAVALGQRLSRLLRDDVELEWTRRSEEVPQAPAEGDLLFRLPATTGDVCLRLAADIVPLLADLLLGAPRPDAQRTLTALERRVLEPIAGAVSRCCAEAGIVLGAPVLLDPEGMDDGPAAVRGTAVILHGRLQIGEATGSLELSMPPFTARAFVPTGGAAGRALGAAQVRRLPSTLSAQIHGGTLRIGELRTLAKGDVVRLDPGPEGSMPVALNGRPAGSARLAVDGTRRVLVLDARLAVAPTTEDGGTT